MFRLNILPIGKQKGPSILIFLYLTDDLQNHPKISMHSKELNGYFELNKFTERFNESSGYCSGEAC